MLSNHGAFLAAYEAVTDTLGRVLSAEGEAAAEEFELAEDGIMEFSPNME